MDGSGDDKRKVLWRVCDHLVTIYRRSSSTVILDVLRAVVDSVKVGVTDLPSHLSGVLSPLFLDPDG